jgi:hypothetical protein
VSVEVTDWIWKHSAASGNDLIVLLKIGDNANSDGGGAYPGIDYLARAARISKRAVYDCLRRLKASGELAEEAHGGGRGRKTTYRVLMEKGAASSPNPPGNGATGRKETVQPAARNGADSGSAYKEEPSLNRPKNPPAPKKGRPSKAPPEVAWDLARLLAESVERRFPQFGKPKISLEWAKEIDLLLRTGPPGYEKGLSEEQVRKLIGWLDAGKGERAEFWGPNIRSAGKLRAKAHDLVIGWHKDHGRPLNGNGASRPSPPEFDPATVAPYQPGPAQEAHYDRVLDQALGAAP